jgi:glycosyltransferase involved in cell wall biosynthesis
MVVKRAEPEEQRHWDEVVAPILTGQETVLEGVAHDEVVSLVAGARAMVFPIQWEEPFGLVMTEALACGTPVITRPLGAACEVVSHGETGFLCDTVEEMTDAVAMVATLSPQACRQSVIERFSGDAMVDGYERLYGSCVVTHRPRARGRI